MAQRREFLAAGLALVAGRVLGQTSTTRQRVVIVGGGWGGLTAAARLRAQAPELDVILVERESTFRSLPLSNPWLVGRTPDPRPQQDYSAVAGAHGYRLMHADVAAIERDQRRVHTSRGTLAYDWLILAAGISLDYTPWLGDDRRAIEAARSLFPSGLLASELEALRSKLAGFRGGDLLMTVPPGPSRCPPAPYERAVMIAWWLKTRGIKGRVLLVDAGGGMARFNRVFAERYPDQIRHLTHATVKSLDPFNKTLSTEFDDLRFDDAMIIPPQRAADLVHRAGLAEPDAPGSPGAWAAVDPATLNAVADPRIFLVGDLLGRVSPLFGHYPKSAHMAAAQGRIAADGIVARVRGLTAPPALPESVCHVFTDAEPLEAMRIEAHYRRRGDGLITHSVRQHEDPQPRGEDVEWARAHYRAMLAP